MDCVQVNLPGGALIGEQWCRSAWLHPVTGREEEFLLNEGRFLSVAARTTQLITRCLRRLGPVEPVGAELVRGLSVGDREALLLHLRRLTVGERVSCLLSCPSCRKKMDLDLQIGELLLSPYPHNQRVHAADIADSDNSYRVTFRVPNGEDQEVVAGCAAESVEAAAESIMRRCVERLESSNDGMLSDLPRVVLQGLPARMAALDPQADVLLDLTCPECDVAFVVPFDAGDYVCRELALQERDLYREVHTLSLHYHWTEEAALGLTCRKRRIYLELLADHLTRGGEGE